MGNTQAQQKTTGKMPRKVKKKKKNMKIPVQHQSDEKYERGEHSGAAEGRGWGKIQKKTGDAILLEEIDEVV